MTGAERAKLSRIRAKPVDKRTPEDLRWLQELEASYRKTIPLDPATSSFLSPQSPPPSMNDNPSPVPGLDIDGMKGAAGDGVEWDRIVDATGNSDDDDADDDDDDAVTEAAPRGPASGAIAGGPPPVSMSLEVARGTAASAFLLMSSGWSIFGDRDSKALEPTDEEMRLLSKVFASYAERFGWTHEIDDMILLGTVLLVYNARASRAPRKTPKLPKPTVGPTGVKS